MIIYNNREDTLEKFIEREKKSCSFKRRLHKEEYMCLLADSQNCPYAGSIYATIHKEGLESKYYLCELK